MQVVLKRKNKSKKFNVIFYGGVVYEYSENLQAIQHPLHKNIWMKVIEKQIVKL